jgi:hypothetical protein
MDLLVDSPVTSKSPQAVALPLCVEVPILLGSVKHTELPGTNLDDYPRVRADSIFKRISDLVRELSTHFRGHPRELARNGFESERMCEFAPLILSLRSP